MQRSLRSLNRAATALARAQELVYDAWEADTDRERVRLAKRALAISKRCADAHVLLAESSAKGIVDMRRHYERGVAAGEAAIGRRQFEEAAGHFWASDDRLTRENGAANVSSQTS